METKTIKHIFLAGLLSSTAIFGGGVQAASFSVAGSLTGDPRTDNPDNLFINVGINVVDTVATWTVDIASPLHPNAKLDEFYFNLGSSVIPGNLSFGGFSPTGWVISNPASTVGGGNFNPTFLFEAVDPPGNGNNVTNAVNLSFTATLNRNWTLDDFYSAAALQSSEATLPAGQLGAHLQSLSTAGCAGCSDSGFLIGNYTRNGGGGGQGSVPEPSVVALLGMGLLGMGLSRKNKV
ncbi:PEP-CTERM sorting domain-containing protein [Methylomonas sp. MO1]|uniref:PEP-CTERM sorting domain-containing protein n=1 Tax=unclassified Methylomonas TaxID=2608980 RepID=UPI00047A0F8D|nr:MULTISPECIES: PEP-CTERM sorting domain-containing protein [unclassified Methylomonas]MDT4288584.1 PEP-CTERM sorting domain-containing protein [Methylomonas sp. MO1]